MSRRTYVTHYDVREIDGSFAVIAQCKSYGSMGPDPGRVEHESTAVEGVSREYAEMLARELTKADFVEKWPGDSNIFTAVESVKRTIGMWTGANSEWAERTDNPVTY